MLEPIVLWLGKIKNRSVNWTLDCFTYDAFWNAWRPFSENVVIDFMRGNLFVCSTCKTDMDLWRQIRVGVSMSSWVHLTLKENLSVLEQRIPTHSLIYYSFHCGLSVLERRPLAYPTTTTTTTLTTFNSTQIRLVGSSGLGKKPWVSPQRSFTSCFLIHTETSLFLNSWWYQ